MYSKLLLNRQLDNFVLAHTSNLPYNNVFQTTFQKRAVQ